MKKTLLFFAFAFLSTSLLIAQEKEESNFGFSEKDIFLSGGINYTNENRGDLESNFFSFSPTIGFFASENWVISGGFIFSTSKTDIAQNALNSFTKRTSFGGTLGASYFFTPQNQFSFLLNLNTSYEKVNYESDTGTDVDLNQFGAAFSPGINYFVSERIALQVRFGAISYISVSNEDILFSDIKRFEFDLDLSNLGFGAIFKL